MKKLHLITMSILVFIFAFGVALLPHAEAAISEWQKAGTIQPFTTTDFASEQMKSSLRSLKAVGANTATLIIPYYQANRQTTEMRPGWNTPTDEALITAIDYAHSLGLKVMIKPHLETDYIEWRGNIDPAEGDRAAWYESYASMLEHYGRIAQAHSVEDYCIGTEILRMASSDYHIDNTQQWQKMIARVRAIYSGKLTYSANWYGELDRIGFWPQLDYIGISAYYDLYHAQNSSPAELEKSWDGWRSGVVEPVQKQYGKPVVFTEIGYRSITDAHRDPWDWSRVGTYNETDQANAYTALFEYWNKYPWMKGVDFWRWEINPPAANSGDMDYSPQNKAAEAVIKAWWGGTTTAQSTVTNPPSSTPVSGTSWSSSAYISPTNPSPGTTVLIAPTIKNESSVSVSNAIVDIEIYNVAGTAVFQHVFESQIFTAGESKNYTINWSAENAGNYTIKVGVFNSNWSYNYYWGNDVKTFAVGSVPTNTEVNIWWPGNGVSVQGVQPFKAMLTNSDVANYNMFWQVDGDRLNPMENNATDSPHKESLVDLTGWTWKTDGIYNINFVAQDKTGTLLKQKSVNITVTH